MRVISKKMLREFWEKNSDAQQSLQAWFNDARKSNWRRPADIKKNYKTASILPDNRIVFNIKGNTYRLVVAINYAYETVYIRFIGHHSDYDKIDSTKV